MLGSFQNYCNVFYSFPYLEQVEEKATRSRKEISWHRRIRSTISFGIDSKDICKALKDQRECCCCCWGLSAWRFYRIIVAPFERQVGVWVSHVFQFLVWSVQFSVHKLSAAGHLPRTIPGRGRDEICGSHQILKRPKYSISLSLSVHNPFTRSHNSLSGLSTRTMRRDNEKVIKAEDELFFQILWNTDNIITNSALEKYCFYFTAECALL